MFVVTFHRLRRWVGLDKAVFYSVLSRAFSTAGSLVTIPLILTRLTSVEQGFYYTFGSILAIGFGAVAIQFGNSVAGIADGMGFVAESSRVRPWGELRCSVVKSGTR